MIARIGERDAGYLPSPREIERLCRQIQGEWSPMERFVRTVRAWQLRLLPPFQTARLPFEPTSVRRPGSGSECRTARRQSIPRGI